MPRKTTNMQKLIGLMSFLVLILAQSCEEIYEQEKYQKPDWLEGKLFTQIETQENLTLFAEALSRIGLDTIINTAGSFTVFAPSDEAMNSYLSEKGFADVQSIPIKELERIVRYHIIQNAWSRAQLQRLDITGWIDPSDEKSKPYAYKRQTILRNPNEKYWTVKRSFEDVIVLDSTTASDYKFVFTQSRKYVPIFFDEFFSIFDLETEDYRFYFDRDYSPGSIHYAGAKVTGSEIFAENGFVYVVDRVVEPLLNSKELLERQLPGESYTTFLELIYQFPRFQLNLQETFDQEAAREGGNFDSLYNLSFPNLPFNINDELTGPSTQSSNFTYRYHNGVFVPTNEAFQKFLDEVVTAKSGFPHWQSFEDMPEGVKQIIVQTHFTDNPVYLSDIREGFEDRNGNLITIDEQNIIRKEYGSNCTFIGLNQTIAPRAFTSITGPVYLRPLFSTFLYAIEYSKLLSALTKKEKEYCFFPISDLTFSVDSSLVFEWIDEDLGRYRFKSFSRSELAFESQSSSDLAARILNQVGASIPTGSADKEFIPTLGGKMLIWNNLDNTVQGTLPNVFGYKGDSTITLTPEILEEPTDNGLTYEIGGWFRFSSANMFEVISQFPSFRALLEKAGLYDPGTFSFPFLVEGEQYTVFIPGSEALETYQADTLQGADLEAFIKRHFVRGNLIFTDNKLPSNTYTTLEQVGASEFGSSFYSLNIRPERDKIDILDEDGNLYYSIAEEPGKTNIPIHFDTNKSPESTSDNDMKITGVAHQIDTVLIK